MVLLVVTMVPPLLVVNFITQGPSSVQVTAGTVYDRCTRGARWQDGCDPGVTATISHPGDANNQVGDTHAHTAPCCSPAPTPH
jgi:hypothetical protein